MTNVQKNISNISAWWKLNRHLLMTNDRKNITQPSDWWTAFEKQAESEGLTLSAWIGEVCKKRLPKDVAKTLSDRPPSNRPPKASE